MKRVVLLTVLLLSFTSGRQRLVIKSKLFKRTQSVTQKVVPAKSRHAGRTLRPQLIPMGFELNSCITASLCIDAVRYSKRYPLSIHCFTPLPMPTHNPFSMRTYRTMPSNRFLNHLTVSSRLILWPEPTLVLHRRRLATRSPGRVMQA